jgi:hypothetical protein
MHPVQQGWQTTGHLLFCKSSFIGTQHTVSFTYCPWLLSCYSGDAGSSQLSLPEMDCFQKFLLPCGYYNPHLCEWCTICIKPTCIQKLCAVCFPKAASLGWIPCITLCHYVTKDKWTPLPTTLLYSEDNHRTFHGPNHN